MGLPYPAAVCRARPRLDGFAQQCPAHLEFGAYVIYFWSNEESEPANVHIALRRPTEHATKVWLTADGEFLPTFTFHDRKHFGTAGNLRASMRELDEERSPDFQPQYTYKTIQKLAPSAASTSTSARR